MCVCVHEMDVSQSKCGCARMHATPTATPSQREPPWLDGVSDGTLITQPSKGGCPVAGVSGGLIAVWWSERLPVGKRQRDEGHM